MTERLKEEIKNLKIVSFISCSSKVKGKHSAMVIYGDDTAFKLAFDDIITFMCKEMYVRNPKSGFPYFWIEDETALSNRLYKKFQKRDY